MKGGWKTVRLGDVSEISYGYTTKASFEDVGPKFLRITDIREGMVHWPEVPTCKIAETDLKKHQLQENDIVFARTGATTGKSYRISNPPEAVAASYLIRLRLQDKEILSSFVSLYFQTKEYWDSIETGTSGSAQGGFNASKLANLRLHRPPLPEQKRIVAILDEAFKGISQAVANAEKNLANARELFESTLQAIFDRANDWKEYTLAQLLDLGWITSHLDGNHGSNYPRKVEFVSEGVPYLSANCLKNNSVVMALAKYLKPERAATLRKGIAQNRDVLFAHNATVGPVAILYTDLDKMILSTSLTYYRCDSDYIIPEYLAQYMRSPLFKRQYEMVMRQSTRNQVPITKQREFTHIIPPLSEQVRIAEHLDDLSAEVKQLEVIYQRKLTALGELKQSLLQKAFSGELTADAKRAPKNEAVA